MEAPSPCTVDRVDSERDLIRQMTLDVWCQLKRIDPLCRRDGSSGGLIPDNALSIEACRRGGLRTTAVFDRISGVALSKSGI
jgi:hypothetical protein